MKKKEIEVLLSQLQTFKKQQLSLEQYQTEASVAADLLWYAYMQGDVKNKVIADFGCGNGIFGIGALLLGAKKVIFLDVDKEALLITKENVRFVTGRTKRTFTTSFSNLPVVSFKHNVDVVITNPPFGVQKTHADKPFLIIAMRRAKIVYSFHKMETRNFVEQFVKDHDWDVQLVKHYDFPLRRGKGYAFWKKKVHYVDVGVWRIFK